MKQIICVFFALAVIVLVLTGCNNAPTTPDVTLTVNVSAIQTKAAQDVIATLTADVPTTTSEAATSPKPVTSSTPKPSANATRPPLPTPIDQSPLPDDTPTLPADAPTPQYSREVEEYAVYSAIIQTRYIDTQEPALIVISDQTDLDYFEGELSEHLESIRQGLPDLTDEVCADFEAQNKQPQPLKSLFTISVKYVFISPQEIQTTFKKQDGWDIFYAKYPNAQGFMHLSGVGFNSQMDMALVYVDNMHYALAGEGHYVLLKKVNGQWTVQDQTMVWIS